MLRISFFSEVTTEKTSDSDLFPVLHNQLNVDELENKLPKRNPILTNWTDHNLEKFLEAGEESCKTIQSKLNSSGTLFGVIEKFTQAVCGFLNLNFKLYISGLVKQPV